MHDVDMNLPHTAEEDVKDQVPCPTCGLVRGPITEEAHLLPKAMQAAFQIPDACLNSNAKVKNHYHNTHKAETCS